MFLTFADMKLNRGMVTTREISITQLQIQDSAVYQCEATNKHGTILATANVDVLGKLLLLAKTVYQRMISLIVLVSVELNYLQKRSDGMLQQVTQRWKSIYHTTEQRWPN